LYGAAEFQQFIKTYKNNVSIQLTFLHSTPGIEDLEKPNTMHDLQ